MDKGAEIKRRAQAFLKNERWDAAIREYEKLVDGPEPDPYLHILIGDVHLKRGTTPAAVERYLRAVAAYQEAGLHKNAIALCKKIQRLKHDKAAVLTLLGELNALDGLVSEAAACFLAAADEDLHARSRETAIERLQKAVAVAPTHADCSRRLVELLIEANRKETAARELLRLAEALRMEGREDAVPFLVQRAKELDPRAELPSVEALPEEERSISEDLEPTHLRANGSGAAAATSRAAAQPLTAPAASGTVSVRDEAPQANGALVDPADILKEFKQQLEEQLSPDDARSHYDMAMAYMDMNLWGDAVMELAAASRDAGLRPKCCEMLGQCYLKQRLPEDARRILERGLETPDLEDECSLSMRYHLAHAQAELGERGEAEKLFEAVLNIRPDFMDARARLDALRLREAS